MRQAAIMMMLGLASCGSGTDDAGVGGVSASEARALNEAAATLDAQSGASSEPNAGLNPAAVKAANADRNRSATDQTTR